MSYTDKLKQQSSGVMPRRVADPRLYFFERLKDEYIFPITGEDQASHLFRRSDFDQKFKFIGVSAGNYHEEYLRFRDGLGVLRRVDENTFDDESNEKMAKMEEKYLECITKEIEEAETNQTKPRDTTVKNIDGGVPDPRVSSAINMIKR